jgi:hypothetical protein
MQEIVGTNNPYTFREAEWVDFQSGCSTCKGSTDYQNINTRGCQAGGAKKKSVRKNKKVRGGDVTGFNDKWNELHTLEETKMSGGAKKSNKKVKKVKEIRGGVENELNILEETIMSGGAKKSNKKVKKVKKMRGGVETEGATPYPLAYYDTNSKVDDYAADSGFGVETAYGVSDPLDAGVGMLAPFNANKNASPLTGTQTGGARKVKKTPSIINKIKSLFKIGKKPTKAKSTKPKSTKPKSTKPKSTKPKSTKPKSTKARK